MHIKKFTIIIFYLLSFHARSQVFNGPGGAILNTGTETYFSVSVSGLSQSQLNTTLGIEKVCIDITHPAVEELQVYLQSPGGMVVQLAEGSSSSGANYTNTCFNNTSGSVTLATAPFSGNFRSIGFLGRFNNGQAANGTWTLIVKDYLAFVNAGSLISWSIKFSNTPVPPLPFSSSDLPIVVINTNSQTLGDFQTLVSMGIIYNGTGVRNYLTDPLNNYNGKANINFRGNSSKKFEKKPYKVETCDAGGNDMAVSLLGMPAESDWILLAMYQDKSLIRVPMTYDFSRKMGHYSARNKTVEVVINNEYQGVYSLMEKLKRDSSRIDIAKLTPLENSGTALTGGYIIKIDRTDEPGWYSLLPGDATNNVHFYYQYVYPKPDSITAPQKNYIKAFVDSFETAMAAPYFANPWIGYQKYIAVPSFIDFFILNELSKNVDAYRLSTYLYKNNISKGGKLHIGPVWDYDIAWHNCNYSNSFDPTGWEYQLTDTTHPTPIWWSRFMQDSSFVNSLYCRWTELRKGVLSDASVYAYVDSSAFALSESQQRNFIQWPILGAFINPNPQNQSGANYQTEVTDLKTWIASRAGWMDWAITGHCPIIGVEENNHEKAIVIYPNPSTGIFNIKWITGTGNSSTINFCNVLGKTVFISSINHESLLVDLSSQPKGIYFYQLSNNGHTESGKIIIQ